MSDARETARAYYRSLDDHDYDRLRDLLAPDVVHRRPDRAFEGRETLVSFMRDDRPNAATTHEIESVYVAHEGLEEIERIDGNGPSEVAVRGRLLDEGGDPLFAFLDVFAVAGGRIETIDTFTR